MKNKVVLSLFLVIFFGTCASALSPWLDTWNDLSYHTTNGENKVFNSFLARSEIRAGVNFNEDLGIEGVPPIGPYLVSILVSSQDNNYWNNQLAIGYGIRVMPFSFFQGSNWYDEWIKDVKLFGEVLSLSNLKDDGTAKTNGVPTSDTRFGLELYYEWNQKDPDKTAVWAETWSNLSYRTSNFYPGDYNTYLFSHQQKIGWHLDYSVKPYLRADLTASSKDEPWWNSLYWGVGIRIEPWRGEKDSYFNNLKMYLEYMNIVWYKESDSRPQSDLRLGIDYRLYLN